MAVHNGEKYVSNAIESILNQTFNNFEFIIIDDMSDDKSREIIRDYCKKDSRIKLFINKKNLGLTKSLNIGISMAKGDFIVRQDDDDVSLPQRLKKQINFLKQNPEYAFCGCNGIIIQTKKKLLNFFELEDIKKNLIVNNCFYHPSIIIRKKIFEKFGLYDESYLYGQDYELWCRLIYKYNLKALNLKDKLIIANIPERHLLNKVSKQKLMTQISNQIKTKLKYIPYAKHKLNGLLSIIFDLNRIFYMKILNFF